jgi:uncharacterized repeat protein (TIGR01451 family)
MSAQVTPQLRNAPAQPRLHALRWTLILSVPLLLMTLLLWSMPTAPVVQAAPNATVFAGCSGAGQTPNFATIQSAVDNVGPGSTVLICTGTYSESVNLSRMGSQSSDTVGNITLRKAPGAATVLINPQIGAGIFITAATIFTGNITLDGLEIRAADDDGINLGDGFFGFGGSVFGDVTLVNLTVSENGGTGATVLASGAISVVNSTFDDNTWAGLELYGALYINSFVPAPVPSFYVDTVQANDNQGYGIYMAAPGGVDLRNTEAKRNGPLNAVGLSGSGIYIERPVEPAVNICAAATPPVESAVVAPLIQVVATLAEDNKGYGLYIDSAYNVVISNTEVYSNAYDGIAAYAESGCFDSTILLEESVAEYNGGSPYFPFGEVHAQGDFVDLPFGGFRLVGRGGIQVLNNNVAEENQAFGYCLFQQATVYDSRAEANVGDGFLVGESCIEAFFSKRALATGEGEGEGDVVIARPLPQAQLFISNTTALSNGGAGFTITVGLNGVTVTNVSAVGNRDGLVFTLNPLFATSALDTSTAFDGIVDLTIPPLVSDSLIQGNRDYGVLYNQIVGADYIEGNDIFTQTFTSTATIDSSIICDNGTGLGAIQSIVVYTIEGFTTQNEYVDILKLYVDARGNWWGAPSGPQNPNDGEGFPDNPTGTGNAVEESPLVKALTSLGNNEADVQFTPWINTIRTSAVPSPTVAGLPVSVVVQFSDGALAYFLQNGVGNLNDAPLFALASDNGNFVGGDPLQQFLVAASLGGNFTPTAAGVANVSLDGPCGLDKTLVVPVVQPAISVDKAPEVQVVAPGATAPFTISVRNTGNITLTNVTVSDAAVPACARTLSDLGIGAVEVYTCAVPVTNNLVNTVVARGQARIANAAAGAVVSDTATAQVLVASLALKKTVYVDGYREVTGPGSFNPSECPLASAITVPVNTTVKFCYTVTNTGNYTVSRHTLVDSVLGPIFADVAVDLAPGASYSTLDAGIVPTQTLALSTINVATWTGTLLPTVATLDAAAAQVDAALSVVASGSATVTISTALLDQDNDGIPDNLEGTGDFDRDGIPDFLDPDAPTGLDEIDQPIFPNQLFLPSLNR